MADTLSNSAMRLGMKSQAAASNPSRNWATLAISMARVKEVQYEELKCTLVVLTGEQDIYEYTGVDITLPGGGKRHFLGSLPERGDICVVGWAARESAGTASARTPIILAWMPAAPWMGHEWIPHQPMEQGEGMDTPRDRAVNSGTMDRVRFKMRHLGPGNVFLSSSQGSDILLDEGVLITNRRANEIRLRDEDQAIVFRSLQQFHAMAGARVYAGMVQREARLLPSTMFSDGVYWDAPRQTTGDGSPRNGAALGANPLYPNGFLTPGMIFRRGQGESQSTFEAQPDNIAISNRLDPFDFLQWGSYVDSNGSRVESTLPGGSSNTIYGGKALYRVGINSSGLPDNAIASALNGENTVPPDALTEYRIEVTHTSKGILPVTEQTDGFDAERLPTQSPSDGNPLGTGTQPFIEWVMGSVVGNDAFSYLGRDLYGIPLKPRILTDEGEVSPGMVSGIGSNLRDHAAYLFRIVSPITGPNGTTTSSFTSFTKDGRFKAYLGGGPISGEIATASDLNLTIGGVLSLDLRSGIRINGAAGPGNVGLNLGSSTGAVVIQGSGAIDTGAGAREAAPNSISGTSSPSVLIDGSQGVAVQSNAQINIHAPEINLTNAGTVNVSAQNLVSIRSGQQVSLTTQVHNVIVSGRETINIGGPENSDPSTGPSRDTTFSATPLTGGDGGVVDRYRVTFGGRSEEFTQGDTVTTVTIGNLTYETNQGKWKCRAGTNSVEVDSNSGLTETIGTGNHSATVSTGSASITAQTDITLRAITGNAILSGTQSVKLVSPGVATGGIMAGSDLDPLTGIPFSTFMPPRGQKLSPI